MKALGYFKAHQINEFSIQEIEVSQPILKEEDLLIQVKAISINPVDCKIRKNRSSNNNLPIILGWDAAGIVVKTGEKTSKFKEGDEVFYAGDLNRDGSNAEFQAVNYKLVAKKPKNLTFSQAASLPLTSITAFEALLEKKNFSYDDSEIKVLIIGGAGGVGSIATQILKAKTKAQVIVTASRTQTINWCHKMGADLVINHQNNLKEELSKNAINEVDVVFGTSHSSNYLEIIPTLLKPFGHFCLIDDVETFENMAAFKQKSISIHWEFMFSKSMFNYKIQTQGKILEEIAQLVENRQIISTENLILNGFSAQNLKKAHEILESCTSIGKIVINI